MDVGVATFAHRHGAEHAFADARDTDPNAGWIRAMYETLRVTADTFVHYHLDPAAEAELHAALSAAPAA